MGLRSRGCHVGGGGLVSMSGSPWPTGSCLGHCSLPTPDHNSKDSSPLLSLPFPIIRVFVSSHSIYTLILEDLFLLPLPPTTTPNTLVPAPGLSPEHQACIFICLNAKDRQYSYSCPTTPRSARLPQAMDSLQQHPHELTLPWLGQRPCRSPSPSPISHLTPL